MQNELIIISEYCDKCHIEPSFIEMLQEGGLIDILTESMQQEIYSLHNKLRLLGGLD